MPRQNRRDRWAGRVIKANNLHSSTRLFLATVLVQHMKPNGYVCVPRSTLARKFGATPRAISRHIQRAKEGGWLVVLAAGYHTHTAEYEARFPEEMKGDATVTLQAGAKGDATKHPSGGQTRHPSGGRRVTAASPQVVTTTRGGDETEMFPMHPAVGADAFGFGDSTKSKKKPTTHLRAV